ncbi:MAG: hypothetical protein JW832_09750 [Deltaproteobacteria bacterium]|nr:hypothetical protein [Deltaproteobacteria bacterium]
MKKHAGKHICKNLIMLCCVLALAPALISCAMSGYYRLTMQYVPQAVPLTADSSMQQYIITAAQFNDERSVLDKSIIGKRVQADGSERKAVSQTMPATECVGLAIKKAFQENGYSVFGGTPDWDGTERTIQKDWRDLVVGGFIEELDVVSSTGFLSAEYVTKVKLRVVFADVQRKRIVYTTTLESSSSYKHFYFSQSRMEQEINNALSIAIEKMFANNKVEEIIDEMSHARGTNIQ